MIFFKNELIIDMQKKNILSLNHEEARAFFLSSESSHGFELPEYFEFDEILQFVYGKIADRRYEDCLADGLKPDELPNVNHDILLNKDGKYAVRPIILANPYLYCFLVRELCSEPNWKALTECFSCFLDPRIQSCAIPVVPEKKEPFYKSSTILNWWSSIEQRSIELSLQYRYMFVTDITNCYGSVNPQSIEWALNRRGTACQTDANSGMAHNVQVLLCALQQGRNIGIPQGSEVFNFVSEIILGYADLLLHERIDAAGIDESYEILRYRDDYRIFCNDKDVLEHISYLLQQVLESLNFRMNSQKTKISDSLVLDSIKSDKRFYIFNTPIFNKKGSDFDSFEKHLLYILMFARQFPDSGQLKTLLSDLDRRMEEHLKPYDEKVMVVYPNGDGKFHEETVKRQRRLWGGSVRAMSAVATQIALENVSACHYALRVISRMVCSLKDEKERWDIIDLVCEKLRKLPNSKYNQLWLQNITYQRDKKNGHSPYDMRLCQLVAGNTSVDLWNNDWLKPELTQGFSVEPAVNREVLGNITPIITFREIRAYYDFDELGELLDKYEDENLDGVDDFADLDFEEAPE